MKFLFLVKANQIGGLYLALDGLGPVSITVNGRKIRKLNRHKMGQATSFSLPASEESSIIHIGK